MLKKKYMVFSLNDQKINNFPTLYLNGIELKKISKLSPIVVFVNVLEYTAGPQIAH